ncbi:MAG: YggS family pyridoxal phosphate-dependent enzyme [Candidatus Acidiferrales bacterium]
MPIETNLIHANLAQIRERIAKAAARSWRRPEEIALIAVSKTHPAEAIRAAYELGVRHFGENRVQEFDSKRVALADLDATWHLIGHLQSNKARRAAQIFNAIDSVDSLALAQKLDSCAAESAAATPAKLPILIEVQLAPEESKAGVAEAELPALIGPLLHLSHLDLRGLMAIPPLLENPEDVRPYFRKLCEQRNEMRKRFSARGPEFLAQLSMGMSHDFEVAIEEGSTQVRIGTALFGSRAIK